LRFLYGCLAIMFFCEKKKIEGRRGFCNGSPGAKAPPTGDSLANALRGDSPRGRIGDGERQRYRTSAQHGDALRRPVLGCY
jgi:hypothetical protein